MRGTGGASRAGSSPFARLLLGSSPHRRMPSLRLRSVAVSLMSPSAPKGPPAAAAAFRVSAFLLFSKPQKSAKKQKDSANFIIKLTGGTDAGNGGTSALLTCRPPCGDARRRREYLSVLRRTITNLLPRPLAHSADFRRSKLAISSECVFSLSTVGVVDRTTRRLKNSTIFGDEFHSSLPRMSLRTERMSLRMNGMDVPKNE